jgi:predicted molibdopterin-dependent oxidoreductase YjgC
MASHDTPELEQAHLVLPVALWAEVDGTFTNFQHRVQRIRRAVRAPGEATPRWEMTAGLLMRLGAPLAATSEREVFLALAQTVPAYAGLDLKSVGATGRALPSDGPVPQEARA